MKKASSIVIASFIIICCTFTLPAMAKVKPIQLSLWNTVQLQNASTSIHGLRLAIYGENEDVFGVDWGIVLKVNGDMVGWQNSCVNMVEGNVEGLQEGIVNMVGGDVWGWQTGVVNMTEGEMIGLQTGLVSFSRDLRGVQFSIVNVTDIQYGLQIGLININKGGTPFGILPIVNWNF